MFNRMKKRPLTRCAVALLAFCLACPLPLLSSCAGTNDPSTHPESRPSETATREVTEPETDTEPEPITVPDETEARTDPVTSPSYTDSEPVSLPVETAPVAHPVTDPAETEPVTDPTVTEEETAPDTDRPHSHSFTAWETTTPASCTVNGVMTRTCACGESETQPIPSTGHFIVADEAVHATRTETGLTAGSHCVVCGEVLVKQTVTPLYDPTPLPAEALQGIFIAKVYGTGKKNTDAAAEHGFVQLYNSTDSDISLMGAALYYRKSTDDAFDEFLFYEDAVIPAHGYYLVRAKSPNGYDESHAVLSVKHYDAKWSIYIDNKEIQLIFAPAGTCIDMDPGQDAMRLPDAVSLFLASDTPHDEVYAVTDMTKNKVAVRTAMTDYSGFHKVNLTKAGMDELNSIRLINAAGETSRVKKCYVDDILFSHDAGVYEQGFELSLSAPDGWTIWITRDGSDPATSPTRIRYVDPILLTDTTRMPWGQTINAWINTNGAAIPSASTLPGGHVIKACATRGNEKTAVYTNTYFITDLTKYKVGIISLSMPISEAFGQNGFYANYCPSGNITAERPRGLAVMETFDKTGDRKGYSAVELAVSGNGSSGYRMKSLRIYFKGMNNGYAGLQSDLDCDIFGGLARDASGRAITSFSRLLLRNSGNDCGVSYIRDAFMQRVSAGLCVDSMASATSLVFINGEFWGIYNLRERYSPEYVESHYGVDKDNVVILESDYAALVYQRDPNAYYLLSAGEAGDEFPFNELSDYILSKDMRVAAYYNTVCEQMDIDSFIDLWVVRLYFNARDWPENNLKVWRNKNPDDPSGFDTKWHFTLLDTDMGFSFFVGENDTSEVSNYFRLINSNSRCGRMMKALLKNTAFREKFIVRYYELVTTRFTSEKLNAVLEDMLAERDPIMYLQEARWPHDGASVSTWNSQKVIMRRFVSDRPNYALRFLHTSKSYTGLTEAQVRAIIVRHFGSDIY